VSVVVRAAPGCGESVVTGECAIGAGCDRFGFPQFAGCDDPLCNHSMRQLGLRTRQSSAESDAGSSPTRLDVALVDLAPIAKHDPEVNAAHDTVVVEVARHGLQRRMANRAPDQNRDGRRNEPLTHEAVDDDELTDARGARRVERDGCDTALSARYGKSRRRRGHPTLGANSLVRSPSYFRHRLLAGATRSLPLGRAAARNR